MKKRCSCVRCVFRTSRITGAVLKQAQLYLDDRLSLQCKLLPVVIKGIICANNWGALMRMHSECPDSSVRLFGGFLHSKGLWKQNCPIISSQHAVQEAVSSADSLFTHAVFASMCIYFYPVSHSYSLQHGPVEPPDQMSVIFKHLLPAGASELFIFSSLLPASMKLD